MKVSLLLLAVLAAAFVAVCLAEANDVMAGTTVSFSSKRLLDLHNAARKEKKVKAQAWCTSSPHTKCKRAFLDAPSSACPESLSPCYRNEHML